MTWFRFYGFFSARPNSTDTPSVCGLYNAPARKIKARTPQSTACVPGDMPSAMPDDMPGDMQDDIGTVRRLDTVTTDRRGQSGWRPEPLHDCAAATNIFIDLNVA